MNDLTLAELTQVDWASIGLAIAFWWGVPVVGTFLIACYLIREGG